MGPGQAAALKWEEASWRLLRIRLLGTGPSTPPSLGGILLQLSVVWRASRWPEWLRYREETHGQDGGFSGMRLFTSELAGHAFIHTGSTHVLVHAQL